MTNNVLALYDLMKKNKTNVSKIANMDEYDFFNNYEYLNYGFGLLTEIRNYFSNLNKEILVCDSLLSNLAKEMHVLDENLLNGYKQINGYLLYDFFKNEYNLIFEELNRILNI